MKVRAQTARPCEKKGDLVLGSSLCECIKSCKAQKGYLKDSSAGTLHHRNSPTTAFAGCLPLEESLIEDHLVRYETREVGGLEVLFEGVEDAQNLNVEIFIEDSPSNVHDYLDVIGDFLTDDRDNDRKLKKATAFDEGLRAYFPEALGFAQNGFGAFAGQAPENIYDSFFETMYARGDFDQENEDFQQLAACFYHGVDDPKEMKKVWPRYTERRYREVSSMIWRKVHKRMPFWAKRFDRIWEKLSSAQASALKAEWFYEADEKPTQKESAQLLCISVASYQERLEWAYKKLEDIFPEFERRKRKNPVVLKAIDPPEPLYQILPSGEKVLIPLPEKKDRTITKHEIHEIKRWVYESSTNYLFKYERYTDIEDEINEDDEDAIEEEIEKEHEDYLKLKKEQQKLKVAF